MNAGCLATVPWTKASHGFRRQEVLAVNTLIPLQKKNTLIQSKSWYNWVLIKIRADFVVVWLRLLPAMQVWCLKGPISSIILIEQSRWIARQQLSRHRNHAVFGICHPSTSSQGILSSVDVLSYTLSHPAWIIALCLSWLNGQCKVKSGQEI